jgi:hypothetical protein
MTYQLHASTITAKYSFGELPREPTLIGTLAIAGLQAAGVSGSAVIGTFTIGATGISVATVVGATIMLSAAIGASLLLQPGAEAGPMAKNEMTIKQPVPARFIDIGRVKSSGAVFFYDAAFLSPSVLRWTLFIGKVISCTEINEIETIYLDDDVPTWTGNYQNQGIAAANAYGDHAAQGIYTNLETARGLTTDTQPNLLAGAFAATWNTAAKALKGLAYTLVAYGQGDDAEVHTNLYPGQPPTVTAVIKGCKLPDPTAGVDMNDRSTWTYGDNAARAILRYLLDTDGWGLNASDLDQPSFVTARALCGEDPGDGLPRYRIWGRYYTTDERSSVLQELLEACDGRLIEQPNGKIALLVGRLVTSNVFLTDVDIIEAQWEPFGDTLDRVGSVRPRIVLETNNWQETDVTPVNLPTPDTDQAVKQVDLPMKYCPTINQARRLAGARLRALNPKWRGTLVTRLRALQAFGDRWINIQFTPLGINQQFEMVGGISLNLQTYSCTLQVRSVESDDYDWGDG